MAEASASCGGDAEIGKQVRRRRVSLDRLGLTHIEFAVDGRPLVQIVPVDEGDRDPGLARAAGAASAVQVGVGIIRNRVVDHVGDVAHVDTSGGDIRGNQDVFLSGLERGHRALALLLVEVAVNGRRVETAVVELLDELGGRAFGSREDHGLSATVGLKDACDDLVFVHVVGAVDDVFDVRLCQPLVGVGRADVDRPVHKAACERHDRAGHRG